MAPSARILPIHSSFLSYPGRQFATTFVPFTASRRQIAVPIPPMPPVTNATRSVIQCFPSPTTGPPGFCLLPARGPIPRAAPGRCPLALDGERYAHAAADAQTRETLLGVAFDHLVDQRHQNAAARRADRMPDRDRA